MPASEWPKSQKVTKQACCRFFGITAEDLEQWAAAGMPVERNRRYDLLAIMQWRIRVRTLESETELKARKVAVQNAMAELRIRRRDGELVSRGETKAHVNNVFHRVRTRLESLPGELAASVPASKRTAFIQRTKDVIRKALKEMAAFAKPTRPGKK